MECALSTALNKFVHQIRQCCGGREGCLTINDLILGIRSERMSELSAWSNSELDFIELHASLFSHHDPLDHVFNLPPGSVPTGHVRSVSSLCAPSPFAWT